MPRRDRGRRPQAAAAQAAGSDRLFRVPPRGRCPQAVGHRADLHARHRGQERSRAAEAAGRRPQSFACARYRATASCARAPDERALRPVVIGTGPCGLFAGLILAQMGFRPIILERGKVVRERTKDTWGLWRKSVLNPESNVQFGEGGAGTFSDGKLYSQIKDPHHLRPQGADRIRQGRRAARNPLRRQAAHRHLPAGDDRGKHRARRSRRSAASIASRARSTISTSTRDATAAGRCAAWCSPTASTSRPIMSCWRSATARATPSRCSTIAASRSRPSRSPSACASSTRNR